MMLSRPHRPPASSMEFAEAMPKWVRANRTLFEYMLPEQPTRDVRKNWVPYLRRCVLSDNCWCYHVAGSQDATVNPRGSDYCELTTHTTGRFDRNFQRMRVVNCTERYMHAKDPSTRARNTCRMPCTTGRGKPCLYGLLPPAKMLSLLAVARAAGVTHIVEEGREGGLSSYIYSLHGFNVTSIEYLPISEVGKALRLLAPSINVLNGDGHVLVPKVVGLACVPPTRRTAPSAVPPAVLTHVRGAHTFSSCQLVFGDVSLRLRVRR